MLALHSLCREGDIDEVIFKHQSMFILCMVEDQNDFFFFDIVG